MKLNHIARELFDAGIRQEIIAHWREWASLLFSLILIVAFYYWARPGNLGLAFVIRLGELAGVPYGHTYFGLIPYVWWAMMSLFLRILLPCLFIWLVLQESVRGYGFRLKSPAPHVLTYLLMFIIMIPVLWLVSFNDQFLKTYPFYYHAGRSLSEFLYYEILYGIQFLSLEAFFRGFLLFALARYLGLYAIPVMVVPYCMIHLGKPALETFASIPAGLILGYLALKSGTWFYGFLLHWAVGTSMDVLAVMQKGGFPH